MIGFSFEEFENNEHKQFGENGFDMMLEKVASIEMQLGIYELEKFTPIVVNRYSFD